MKSMEWMNVVLNNIRCGAKAGMEWIVRRSGGGGLGEGGAGEEETVAVVLGVEK